MKLTEGEVHREKIMTSGLMEVTEQKKKKEAVQQRRERKKEQDKQ